ncbi:HdeD family acid-resistance protein [Mycobacterium sp.]|uniref:HdeD family acid-resistance protein n=1 Tax=Mycobacterium sp. TaxID=1785 RepID=UPI002B7BEC2C|nr:HdeD family acid-resistance protein [Mycobacterium sp.]HTY34608.1 HdeD family acid-resistance protein [Mycobacterium sp.]
MTSPEVPEVPVLIRDPWAPVLLVGALTVTLGAVVLGWPSRSIVFAAVMLGVYLVASGIAAVLFAFSLHVAAGDRALLFIVGALSLVLGIFSFRHFGGGYAVWLLAVWIGVGFVFQGVAATTIGVSHKELPGRGWTIVCGVLSLIAGVVVLGWPFDSIAVLAIVAGVWLVIIGLTEIVMAFAARSDLNRAGKVVTGMAHGARQRAA